MRITRLLCLTAAAVALTPALPAQAHGAMQWPVSRSYACYLENPESPRTAACRAAVSAGGTQPMYDWNEVNIANAAGRHRELIPDGRLCSAGRDKYRGLELARGDWPATTLASGAATFQFKGTAPHRGTFELYLTKPGFNPAAPLRWSDLDSAPFLRATDPRLVNGVYLLPGTVPSGRTGRHLIYTIWQRSDSPEAFYACSDVDFGGSGTPPNPPPPASPTPSAKPVPTPAGTPTPTPCPAHSPTPTPATSPSQSGIVARPSGSSHPGPLPLTGMRLSPVIWAGAILITAGAGALVLARRRATTVHRHAAGARR